MNPYKEELLRLSKILAPKDYSLGKRTPDVFEYEKAILVYYDVTIKQLRTKSRKGHNVNARMHLAYFYKTKMNYTYAKIGQIFNRDHASMLNMTNKYEGFVLTKDKRFLLELRGIKSCLVDDGSYEFLELKFSEFRKKYFVYHIKEKQHLPEPDLERLLNWYVQYLNGSDFIFI